MRAVVMQLFKEEPERRPERLGQFEFVELPRIGDDIMVADDIDLTYYRVVSVVHYPIAFPFARNEELPNLQETEPSAKVEVVWAGVE
jgi:hypothetical protein